MSSNDYDRGASSVNSSSETALIKATFDQIPVREVLAIARRVQSSIVADPRAVIRKNSSEIVTKADLEIQRILIQYFAESPLAGMYKIKAEEETARAVESDSAQLQLLIDPLDGTNPFVRGEPLWGTMVGLCNSQGVLQYSWNLLSDGSIYSSNGAQELPPASWESDRSRELAIDLFDYGAGVAMRAAQMLGRRCRATSMPSAVWTGWMLLRGELDGLLWLPSSLGKRSYPDYDLVFLGALAARGFKVALGLSSGASQEVAMVAVAPCEAGLEQLWNAGVSLLSGEQRAILERSDELRITAPISLEERGSL